MDIPREEQRKLYLATLDFHVRYRMGLPRLIHRLPCFSRSSIRLVRRVLHWLSRRERLLGSAPLHGKLRYWYLSEKAAGILGPEQVARTGPLDEREKIRAYAVLLFCFDSQSPREKLTGSELRRHFGQVYRPGLPLNHYVVKNPAAPKLGYLRVDTGGRGRWDRLVEYCRRDIRLHRRTQAAREFLERGFFEMTVITALEQKAGRLRQALAPVEQQEGVPIHVHAIPELLELIAPAPEPVTLHR